MKHPRLPGILAALAAVTLAVSPPEAPGQAAGGDPATRMDSYLAAAQAAGRFSGTILAARGGRILLCKGYGMANYELDVPNAPQIKFRLGSITKQFTSLAILKLEEQGQLKVTDSLKTYFPDYPQGEKITIHHLLTHTSGIPDMTGMPDYPKTMALPSAPLKTIERFKNLPLEFTPGEKFAYSNSGYILLGAIIEKVTGRSYEEYLRETILKPLGMDDTGYDHHEIVLKNRASGYEFPGDVMSNVPYIDMSIPHAAGALYSTVTDLYKWDRALYTDKLLSKADLVRMFTPFKGGYAYGWFIGEAAGHKTIRHSGGINGFTTDIVRFPDDDACVIVLANYVTGYTQEVSGAVASLLFGQAVETPKPFTFVKVPAAVLAAYAGRYRMEGAPMDMVIVRERDGLAAEAAGQPRVPLHALSETRFVMKHLGFTLTFVRDATGRVTHFLFVQGKHETKVLRVG